MMSYDFVDGSTEMSVNNGLETKENMHLYSNYSPQDNFLKTTSNNSNHLMTNGDIWSSNHNSTTPSTSSSSFYFPSSFDFNMSTTYSHPSQYSTLDNSNYDYQTIPDVSSSYISDPYASQMFNSNYPMDPYSNANSTSYSTNSIDYSSSNYLSHNDSYQHLYPMYSTGTMSTNTNVVVPNSSGVSGTSTTTNNYLSGTSIDIPTDYQSSISPWDSTMMKMRSHDVNSASNSSNGSTSASKQPCLVCHEESSGYHFGAYTCESCKAFYRRATKDPRIQIKHSCEVPLPNINKANRKDCRACRKAKCDRVGMTAMPKDRSTRSSTSTSSCAATTTTTTKTSPMMVTELLDQLAHDLSYDQLMNSSAFDTILRLLEFPSLNPIQLDYHSLYMDAMRTWRNQYNHVSTHLVNIPFTDIFAVLLFLFRTFMIINENDDDKSTENSQFDKLVSILHEEIQRLTGTDQRSACRLKALFMKCYVALAQNVVMT